MKRLRLLLAPLRTSLERISDGRGGNVRVQRGGKSLCRRVLSLPWSFLFIAVALLSLFGQATHPLDSPICLEKQHAVNTISQVLGALALLGYVLSLCLCAVGRSVNASPLGNAEPPTKIQWQDVATHVLKFCLAWLLLLRLRRTFLFITRQLPERGCVIDDVTRAMYGVTPEDIPQRKGRFLITSLRLRGGTANRKYDSGFIESQIEMFRHCAAAHGYTWFDPVETWGPDPKKWETPLYDSLSAEEVLSVTPHLLKVVLLHKLVTDAHPDLPPYEWVVFSDFDVALPECRRVPLDVLVERDREAPENEPDPHIVFPLDYFGPQSSVPFRPQPLANFPMPDLPPALFDAKTYGENGNPPLFPQDREESTKAAEVWWERTSEIMDRWLKVHPKETMYRGDWQFWAGHDPLVPRIPLQEMNAGFFLFKRSPQAARFLESMWTLTKLGNGYGRTDVQTPLSRASAMPQYSSLIRVWPFCILNARLSSWVRTERWMREGGFVVHAAGDVKNPYGVMAVSACAQQPHGCKSIFSTPLWVDWT
uniref:Uncharacterized protein n=1 Tax=Chromera velia CCMP2878 TaxID=1169474 RepID=A0A0G4HH45_9ALVE|eukprot:Cvel_27549.t1-p1 / transcript=Cvel_27549.t1 / gene=Cvel_27549 / organism=Chromera_velia_CCMP2878 / gene_product=hypothetical protein / transcript_product=hypothetical protein / location=Cvel_scaffold3459:2825-4907(-) / protein_length=535 / sequence_SO=supercontig / SO=protein_coding / is_pseudo=false